ncbi:hypothetical protein K8B33_06670 [Alcanivorax sp. JB21]|uniref:hypothetical protein n=1 Tax=Alcanivorax limicola TaxID=2874102 RepID=UPI001CBB9ADB|nr:hypothetical protein [Alcanivorax limicola]MBZ2188771.1 hypothetical protein [Alcanivorax limicola]
MNGWLSRSALLAALALVLAACGGSNTQPTAAPGGSGAPGSSDQPLLTVVDTNNEFSIAFCPNTASMGTIGEVIDRIACENEALQGISAADADLLSVFCPNAAEGFSVIGVSDEEGGSNVGILPLDFGPACLAETTETLQNIQSLLGNNPLTAALCPIAAMQSDFDPAGCFTEAASMFSDFTPPSPAVLTDLLGDLCPVAALGPLGPTTPVDCLTEVGGSLANAQELLLGPNVITVAICPVAAMAEEFDPAACISETASAFIPGGTGGGGFDGLPGFDQLPGIGDLCDADSDPLTCLLALGDELAPLLEMADGIPVLGDILAAILGGGDGGAPGGDIPELPGFDACDPADPASCLSALTELLAPLADLLDNVPVLGDIINGILSGELPEFPGGDGGELPAFPGFDDCDPTDPAGCLSALTDLLAPLSDALAQIPVLGDVVNSILSGELPEFPGGDGGMPELPGFDACDPADPASCLAILTDALAPLSDALGQIPVLGDIINGLLAGEVPEFPGGDGGLPELPGFDACDPADPASCLAALAGLADQLGPLTELLADIPVLGDLINALLAGEAPEFPGGDLPGGDFGDFCDPTDPASCLALLTDALAPVTDGLSAIPGLGDALDTLLGALEGGDTSGIEDIPIIGPILGALFGLFP